MKLSSTFALSTTAFFTAISAVADVYPVPALSKWKAGTAAVHTKVKDQGDVGFCWANAWTSYLEAKVLMEQNKEVDLSAMYVARTHMARQYVDTLAVMNHPDGIVLRAGKSGIEQKGLEALFRYREMSKNPFELAAVKPFLTQKLQDYSVEDLEGHNFFTAFIYGVTPASVYEKKEFNLAPLGPVAGAVPPYENRYHSPSYQDSFQNFIADHLMNESDMENYLSEYGVFKMEIDFDRSVGNQPISEASVFNYEGKKYFPLTFLRDYIGFDPSRFSSSETKRAGYADDENFDTVVSAIQNELDHRRPVLLGMAILDDNDNNPDLINTGLMDPAYCLKPGKCTFEGGHAVLIVNSMKDENGVVKAFIIQNSWGPQGTDENGVQTKVRAKRGFNIVTMDYLKAGAPFRGFAFRYMMM